MQVIGDDEDGGEEPNKYKQEPVPAPAQKLTVFVCGTVLWYMYSRVPRGIQRSKEGYCTLSRDTSSKIRFDPKATWPPCQR